MSRPGETALPGGRLPAHYLTQLLPAPSGDVHPFNMRSAFDAEAVKASAADGANLPNSGSLDGVIVFDDLPRNHGFDGRREVGSTSAPLIRKNSRTCGARAPEALPAQFTSGATAAASYPAMVQPARVRWQPAKCRARPSAT